MMQDICTVFTVLFVSGLVLALYGLHRCWILYLYFRYYKWAPRSPRLPGPTPPFLKSPSNFPSLTNAYVVERLIDSVCRMDYRRRSSRDPGPR